MGNARKTFMGNRTEISKFLTQQPITGDVERIAAIHEINRQNTVKEILVHVFLMAKFKLLTGNLTVGAAQTQYYSASGINQAAHCAPGQISSGGKKIQELLAASDELSVALDNLFGVTDDLDANYNKADSVCEDKGLRNAFGNACIAAAQSGAKVKFERAYQFAPYVNTAFGLYQAQGIIACRDAITHHSSKLHLEFGKTRQSREERIFITQTYLKTLSEAPESVETVQGLFLEDLWRDYRKSF